MICNTRCESKAMIDDDVWEIFVKRNFVNILFCPRMYTDCQQSLYYLKIDALHSNASLHNLQPLFFFFFFCRKISTTYHFILHSYVLVWNVMLIDWYILFSSNLCLVFVNCLFSLRSRLIDTGWYCMINPYCYQLNNNSTTD